MGGSNSWRQPQTFADLQRNTEKRVLSQERRPQVRTAADILGPGIAPYAVEILDWNGDETSFNGFFWSQPGAINSPDPANSKWYMGQVEATSDGFGLQWATEFRDIVGNVWPPRSFIRRFFDPGTAGTRTFSAWAEQGDGHYLGEMIMYGSETPPTEKWLFCNGAAVSRAIYSEFFAKFQTMPWGIGNGTTTFNIPDFRRRHPRGSFEGGGYPVGHDEGAPQVVDRDVRHSHPIAANNPHTHDQGTLQAGLSADRLAGSLGRATQQITGLTGPSGGHDHSGATGQNSEEDFPYSNIPMHIKVLP